MHSNPPSNLGHCQFYLLVALKSQLRNIDYVQLILPGAEANGSNESKLDPAFELALLEVEDVHWAKGSLETGCAAGGGAEEPPSKSPTTGAGVGATAAGVGAGAAGADV